MEIESFDELTKYLREFDTWDHRGGYDFNGMVHLLGACIDNLRRHALPEEIAQVKHSLERHQLAFLNQILTGDGETKLL